MKNENVYVVRKVSIAGEHPTLSDCYGQSSLWAKCLWVEFALGKVLVDKVPGFWIRRLGIPFCLQNKFIVD